jgi:hypothetical protein
MLRFKMLARDINSNPTQYRTWVVPNTPDFTGQFYTGYKSGANAFVDVVAYAINDDSVIADFDLPTPSMWNPVPGDYTKDYPIQKNLPFPIEDSQLAIIDGYGYMFGGKVTNKIFKAELNNPADWFDTGAVLPTPLYGSSFAVVDGYMYLFGGHDGYDGYDGYSSFGSSIFSAPVSNPLNWTDTGATLPIKLAYSSLGMYDGYLYLFGGQQGSGGGATNVILTASASNPLVWTNTGQTIPSPVYGSVLAQVDGYWMLYGGLLNPNTPTQQIWDAPVTSPTSWMLDGYLPYPTAHGQFITMGNDGYLIAPVVGAAPTGFTPILQCHLGQPSMFMDTQQVVRGVISHSQVAIIYDRVWFFGGSGSTSMFACNQILKYPLNSPVVQAYGQITRVLLPATDNLDNPYQALCFPYWKTDYVL